MSALQCPSAVEPPAVSSPPREGELGRLAARVAGQDVSQLDGNALVDYLQDCHRLAAAAESEKLAAAARLAEDSTHSDHGPAGSAFDCAASQVSLALRATPRGADRIVDLGMDLQHRLPATLQRARAGQIDPARARVLSEETSTLNQEIVTTVESRLLPIAARLTPGQLRARVRRMVIETDPDAAQQRHHDKVADRGVHLADEGDATAALTGFGLPADKALGAYQYVDAWARQLRRHETPETGHTARSLDQIRADLLCDLLTGNTPATPAPAIPDSDTLPGMQPATTSGFVPIGRLHLTVPLATLTGQSSAPAEAAGFGPLLAEITRTLAERALASGSRHCWTVEW